MSNHVALSLIIILIIGVVIGVILASIFNPKLRRHNALKKELDATKQQLVNQKKMLVKHFSHSAELLDKMANDFRHLYQHMAENSTSLLTDVEFNEPRYAVTDFDKNDDRMENLKLKEQPKDYPSNPSGLLKTEKDHKR